MVRTRFTLEFKSKVIHFYDSRQNQTDKKEKSINLDQKKQIFKKE